MVAFLDRVPRLSFSGIEFPYEEIEIKGQLRDHHHEYPHSPGADPEKLGRRLYTISVMSKFDEGMHRVYPGLFPDKLDFLFSIFEIEQTSPLVLPNIGTIQAYCRNWSRRLEVMTRSGESVQFEFVEDRSADFLFDELRRATAAAASTSNALTHAQLAQMFLDNRGLPAPQSLFDALDEAVGSLEAVRGQADMAGNLLMAKALRIAEICQELDRAIQDPLAHLVLDGIKRVWEAANLVLANTVNKPAPTLGTYVVGRRTTIQQVSLAVYGTTERSFEILQINDVEDAFAIPAGTTLRYYVDSAKAA